MKKNNKIILNIVLATIVILIVMSMVFSFVHFAFGDYYKYSEWITLCITSVISILGIVVTIVTILLAVGSINENKKNTSLRKRKLAIILKYELDSFLISLFNTYVICMMNWSINGFDKNDNPKADFSNLNMLSEDFKEMLFELITIDDNKNSMKLFEFYKLYQDNIKRFNREDLLGLTPLLDVLEYSFNEEYYNYAKLTGLRFNGRCTRVRPLTDEEQNNLKEFYKIKHSLYINKERNTKINGEYTDSIKDIFKYLKEMINY